MPPEEVQVDLLHIIGEMFVNNRVLEARLDIALKLVTEQQREKADATDHHDQ
jgi:hypothetical protein